MKYRLMEIADLYSEYIKQIDPIDNCLTYDALHKKVLDDHYCESDYIHWHLRNEFGIETEHIYYNYSSLQNRWDNHEDKDPFSILLRQVKAFQPDVILVMDLRFFTSEQIQIIKQHIYKEVHFITYHFSSIDPLVKSVLSNYELVLTGSNFWAEKLKDYSKKVCVVRHAFEPSILKKLDHVEVMNKVGFVGSIMIGRASGHTNRIDLLSALIKNGIPFDFYGKVYGSFLRPKSLLNHLFHNPTKLVDRIKTECYLKRSCKQSRFGIEYYNTLKQYAINLNIHADMTGAGAGNMRMFEVTGVGSCLVTDYREENELLFEDGKEIVSFKNYTEMVNKVKHLLACPEEAKEIAANGQKRTLMEHNYYNKAKEINDLIQELLVGSEKTMP